MAAKSGLDIVDEIVVFVIIFDNCKT